MEKDLTQVLKLGDILPTRDRRFAKIISLDGTDGRPIMAIIADPMNPGKEIVKRYRSNGRVYTGYNKTPFDLIWEDKEVGNVSQAD